MPSLRVCAFLFAAVLVANPLTGQDGKKKDDPKAEEKDKDPAPKYKGQLPPNWKKLGMTDEQTQTVYKVQAKYGEKIDKLEDQIKELKGKRDKERYDILTKEQQKRLEELSKPKAGG